MEGEHARTTLTQLVLQMAVDVWRRQGMLSWMRRGSAAMLKEQLRDSVMSVSCQQPEITVGNQWST